MLLIPMEARPTSRENLAAQTLHLEGEPQSSDLPGVLRGKEQHPRSLSPAGSNGSPCGVVCFVCGVLAVPGGY